MLTIYVCTYHKEPASQVDEARLSLMNVLEFIRHQKRFRAVKVGQREMIRSSRVTEAQSGQVETGKSLLDFS